MSFITIFDLGIRQGPYTAFCYHFYLLFNKMEEFILFYFFVFYDTSIF